MNGRSGNTVNDTTTCQCRFCRDSRRPAGGDVNGATPGGPYGISASEEYRTVMGLLAPAPARPPERPAKGTLATDLSLAAGEVVALCIERHSKYGAANIANTPGGALNGIIVRLFDKLSRLAHSDADFADESVNDTINDIVGYGLIASLVVNNKWPKS